MSEAYLEAWVDMAHLPSMFGAKDALASLAVTSGLPCDQLRFVLTLLSVVPIGWGYRYIPGAFLKHLFSIIVGAFCAFFVVGFSFLNILVSSTIVYIMISLMMPSSDILKKVDDVNERAKLKEQIKARRQLVGQAVFIFSMLYICVSHIYRLYVDYLGYRVDFTAPQMMLTLKMVSFAWQRVDGEILNDGDALDDIPSEEKYRTIRALRKMPSLLEYYGFIFHFASVIAGPSIEYYEYSSYIDGTLWTQYGLKELPFSFKAPLIKLGYMLMVYPGLVLAGKYSIGNYCNTEQFFIDYPTRLGRIVYITVFNGFARYKYYFAWYLAEAGCVATGISLSGYDPKTGVVEWEGCNNCRAYMVETCSTSIDLINHWNIRVSEWLKHMVYMRATTVPSFLVGKIGPKQFANIMTKFTSAFWHGFYPGYYIFFFQVWFIGTFETKIRALILPYFSKPNPEKPSRPILEYPKAYIYRLIMNVFVMGSFNWLGSCFVLLEFWPSVYIQAESFFFYHIIGLTLLVFLPMVAKSLRSKRKESTKVVCEGDVCAIVSAGDNEPVSPSADKKKKKSVKDN